jgi:hypothetical protein
MNEKEKKKYKDALTKDVKDVQKSVEMVLDSMSDNELKAIAALIGQQTIMLTSIMHQLVLMASATSIGRDI